MLYRLLIFGLITITVFMSGCNQEKNKPEDTNKNSDSIILDKPFNLKANQTAVLESEDLEIRFLKITEDSRCPSDVTCIWAGQVGAMINVAKDKSDLGNFTLISGAGNKDLESKSVVGYVINLAKVEPYPVSTKKIQPTDYIVTLVVNKPLDEQAY